jgi:hypothetical protein
MFIINGFNSYDMAAARFQLEFAARQAEAKEASIVDLAAARAARDRKKRRHNTSDETAA